MVCVPALPFTLAAIDVSVFVFGRTMSVDSYQNEHKTTRNKNLYHGGDANGSPIRFLVHVRADKYH